VSRSDSAGESRDLSSPLEKSDGEGRPNRSLWPSRDEVEFNELNISLKISYKTLILVFVLFDVFHKLVDSVDLTEVNPF